MSRILAVQPVLADHRYTQQEITDAFVAMCPPVAGREPVVRRLHGNAQVAQRSLALPLPAYADLDGFTGANDAFLDVAVDLGARALTGALEQAGLTAADVDLVISTTVTGIAVPSLEARIAARVGLRPDVRRLPLMGLGCVAGAAGLARLHDYLLGHPKHIAVLLSVELCSLTVQREDASMANLVASGLFGDGAAAVVVAGAERHGGPDAVRSGPVIIDSRSHLYPDSERVMGWDVGSSGFRIVLSPEVPAVVRANLGADVHGLLSAHGLTVPDIDVWVAHPGGPAVLDAVADALELSPEALELTWRSLAEVGNLSSSSVLHVLADTMAKRACEPGSSGVMFALGPGFCSEIVLLRW